MKKNYWLTYATAMLSALSGTASATLPDITATRCDGCTEQQFETKAISLGTGKKYLYDFTGRKLRHYQVSREPKMGGGYLYEAIELGADPAYLAYFGDSLAYRDLYGTFAKTVVINLLAAPNTGGHASDSVFSLFLSSEGATNFGSWLGGYFASQGIPVSFPDAAERLDGLIRDVPGITYTGTGDDMRLVVVVEFKDGEATFDLTDNEKRYKLRPGTAIDSDGHPIPENAGQVRPVPYGFPGGPGSSNYLNFQSLMGFYGIPIGSGGWSCGTASGGGSSSVNCVYIR